MRRWVPFLALLLAAAYPAFPQGDPTSPESLVGKQIGVHTLDTDGRDYYLYSRTENGAVVPATSWGTTLVVGIYADVETSGAQARELEILAANYGAFRPMFATQTPNNLEALHILKLTESEPAQGEARPSKESMSARFLERAKAFKQDNGLRFPVARDCLYLDDVKAGQKHTVTRKMGASHDQDVYVIDPYAKVVTSFAGATPAKTIHLVLQSMPGHRLKLAYERFGGRR